MGIVSLICPGTNKESELSSSTCSSQISIPPSLLLISNLSSPHSFFVCINILNNHAVQEHSGSCALSRSSHSASSEAVFQEISQLQLGIRKSTRSQYWWLAATRTMDYTFDLRICGSVVGNSW